MQFQLYDDDWNPDSYWILWGLCFLALTAVGLLCGGRFLGPVGGVLGIPLGAIVTMSLYRAASEIADRHCVWAAVRAAARRSQKSQEVPSAE